MAVNRKKRESSSLLGEAQNSEAASSVAGVIPYINTLKLYFFDPEELGRRIHERKWDGISKPFAVGAGSLIIAAILFSTLGINADLGKFPILLLEFVKDFWFFGIAVFFLIVSQVVARKSFAWDVFVSGLLAYVYVIAMFILPFCCILTIVHFSKILMSLSDLAIPLSVLAIAPLFGYTLFLALPRILAGVYQVNWFVIFGTFLIYSVIVVWVADRLFPMWQIRHV